MGVRIDPLSESEVPAAARLLARAFAHDPVIGWYLSGPSRESGLRAFFRAPLYGLVSSRTVYAVRGGGDLVGVAAWVPPNAPPPAPDRRVRDAERTLEKLYPSTAARLLAGFEALSAFHPAEPHWYLAFVGLEPEQQGEGIGASLLGPVLDRADADGTLCYLETPFVETHPF